MYHSRKKAAWPITRLMCYFMLSYTQHVYHAKMNNKTRDSGVTATVNLKCASCNCRGRVNLFDRMATQKKFRLDLVKMLTIIKFYVI